MSVGLGGVHTFALLYIPAPVNRQGDDPDVRHRHNTSAVVACISDYPDIPLVTNYDNTRRDLTQSGR